MARDGTREDGFFVDSVFFFLITFCNEWKVDFDILHDLCWKNQSLVTNSSIV